MYKKNILLFIIIGGLFVRGAFVLFPPIVKKLVTENSPDVIGSMLFCFTGEKWQLCTFNFEQDGYQTDSTYI
jgi:hypothetical protein